MSLTDKVAANLHRIRKAKRMTQLEVAEGAHFSVSFISMLERGERSPPLPTLEKVARALNVSPLDLVSGWKATRHG